MSQKGRVTIARNLHKEEVMIDKDGNLVEITDLGYGKYKKGFRKLQAGEGEKQDLK